jgi:hypothetical protein
MTEFLSSKQVDPVSPLLITIVEQLLNRRGVTLAGYRGERVPYTTFLSGRAVWSFSGTAVAQGEHIPWKLILKIIEPPESTLAGATDSRALAREFDAYQSGLLDDLHGSLRAPRVVHLGAGPGGSFWLWLEHVVDVYERHWPLAAYGVAARHLGQFNGAYLTNRSLPNFAWLMSNWADWNSEPARAHAALAELERLLVDGRVQAAFPAPIANRARRLLANQPRFLELLAALPQTLCHHDAAQANLIACRRADGDIETVAIDWESIGPGTIGADLATLVFGTLRRGEVTGTDAEELERVAFAGYVAGLRDAGWQGSEDQVRLGYVTAVALRWSLLLGTLRSLVDDAARIKASRDWNYSPGRLLQQWIPLSAFLLDRADEVERLS